MDRGSVLARSVLANMACCPGGGRSIALWPLPSVSSLGQLLWAVLDWLFDWPFWLPGC